MEGKVGTRSCILELAGKIYMVRQRCLEERIPEDIQDTYEDVIDSILKFMGISEKQRDLFWTLTDTD